MSLTCSNPTEPHTVLDSIARAEQDERRRENDQRRASRKTVRVEALINPLLDSALTVDPIRVSIRDISMTGMGFLTSVPLPPGSLWRMAMLVDRHTLGQQAFTVRHCRALSAGVCVIGAQFCVDPALISLMGLKLSELVVIRSADDPYDVDFVSPESLA
ncbi:MAG: PilZ domain-containing protein [Phycisphaeraceae bacterium]